jgi:succinoglycan biosynthesis transport protein ExoP
MRNFQSLDFLDYLRIIRRRILYLIIPAVLASAGTIVYVSRLPSMYRSSTTIAVNPRLLPDDYIGSLVRETATDRIAFVAQQLSSRTFLERIVQEFQLAPPGANVDDYINMLAASKEITGGGSSFTIAFVSTQPDVAQRITQRLAERVMQLNDTFRRERVRIADDFLEEQIMQATNEVAQSDEKIREFYKKHFPGIPEDQAAILQTLNDLGRERVTVENSIDTITTETKLLEQRRQEQQKFKIAMSSRAPAAARAEAQSRQPSRTEQILAAKRDQLAAERLKHTDDWPDIRALRREIKQLEDQVANEISAAKAPPKTSETTTESEETAETPSAPPPEQVADTSLPQLDFSIDFSDFEMQLRLEKLAKDLKQKQELQEQLVQRINQYKSRVNAPPEVLDELSTLERQRQISNQRYELLSGKKFSSDLAGRVDTDINNQTFKVIDPANLPVRPFGPNRDRMIAIGCLASLALGIALVFVREFLDSTLGDDDTAASELKMPILASVPNIPAGRKKRAEKTRVQHGFQVVSPTDGDGSIHKFSFDSADAQIKKVVLDPLTVSGEQFRVVRAQLSALQKKRNLSRILIASAIPNEGKTFSACCLSGILAQEPGKRVLLIDADVRTGSVSHTLGLGARITGLSDVLRGSATVEESLVECSDLNFSVLPSGTIVQNPTEVLSSPEFERVMNDLAQLFDWIIVDSPPSLAMADADLLLRQCDAALLVVNADKTPLKLIKDALERMGRDRVCGVLMNRVRNLSSSHYYSRYYRQASLSKR